jgi:hypothetical protein
MDLKEAIYTRRSVRDFTLDRELELAVCLRLLVAASPADESTLTPNSGSTCAPRIGANGMRSRERLPFYFRGFGGV